jgi:HSP20 family protein
MNNIARMRENLFKDFFEDWALMSPRIRPLHGRLLPEDFPVDIRETDGQYMIEAEIPGLKKDDIKVEIDGRALTISAEVKQESEEKDEGRIVQRERYYGAVSRSFTLGCDVDSSSAKASYHGGVLRLQLSKISPASGQRIEIQ